MKLSILIPCRNETTELQNLVDNIRVSYHEIILLMSHDISTETHEICKRIKDTKKNAFMHYQHDYPGVGLAYREGFRLATGTHIAMLEGDGEANPATLQKMMLQFDDKSVDVCVASRWQGEFYGYNPTKKILNYSFNKIFSTLLSTRISDLTFTYKILKKSVADEIKWSAQYQDIGAETTMMPIVRGYTVVEVPTTWTARPGASDTTLSLRKNLLYVAQAIKALSLL